MSISFTGQRHLAILGALGVVLLSLARLAIDGFYLVAVHFKNNPLEGLLFFVPPLTFYYLAKRGKTMKRIATRLFTSVALIAGVILAFVFVPTLSSGAAATQATVGERVKQEAGTLREDFKSELDRGANALEKAAAGVRTPIQNRRSEDAAAPQ